MTPHNTPVTDTLHWSDFSTAHAVPDQPDDGNEPAVASKFPLLSSNQTTNVSAYALAVLVAFVSAVACAVDTGLLASLVLSTFQSHTSDLVRARSVFSVAIGTSSTFPVRADVLPL